MLLNLKKCVANYSHAALWTHWALTGCNRVVVGPDKLVILDFSRKLKSPCNQAGMVTQRCASRPIQAATCPPHTCRKPHEPTVHPPVTFPQFPRNQHHKIAPHCRDSHRTHPPISFSSPTPIWEFSEQLGQGSSPADASRSGSQQVGGTAGSRTWFPSPGTMCCCLTQQSSNTSHIPQHDLPRVRRTVRWDSFLPEAPLCPP